MFCCVTICVIKFLVFFIYTLAKGEKDPFGFFRKNRVRTLNTNVQNGTDLQQNNNPSSEIVNPTSINQNEAPPFSSNWYR
jgi:hypothetical protein